MIAVWFGYTVEAVIAGGLLRVGFLLLPRRSSWPCGRCPACRSITPTTEHKP